MTLPGLAKKENWAQNRSDYLVVCECLTGNRSSVFLGGEELESATQFLGSLVYLGVILDSNITFKKHIQKVTNTIQFNLQNYKQIRSYITTDAAKFYLYCMIFSPIFIEYCFTVWSFAGVTALKPFKKAVKVFDRKRSRFTFVQFLRSTNS